MTAVASDPDKTLSDDARNVIITESNRPSGSSTINSVQSSMSIKAYFVGINKYQEPNIRDLAGAARDATSLWALFTDTIAGIQSVLLVDADATRDAVEAALDEVLTNASDEDVVIFTFAGHGTHDHRLVLHDTDTSDLDASAIRMSELAEKFRASKAKAILCVLDCCFSGGAPSRVLEDSPVARDLENPYPTVAGNGRILLAASNFDEPAYELPGGGNGILTKALLNVLQDGNGVIEMQEAMSEVLNQVRALAAGMGIQQTPVHLGYIEGGSCEREVRPILKAVWRRAWAADHTLHWRPNGRVRSVHERQI